MLKTPKVSIALPLHNDCELLEKCIDSILAQDFHDFELVIFANNVNKNTHELIKEKQREDNRVKIYQSKQTLSQIDSFNKAFELSIGEYFRWIGSDDWLESNYVSSCLEIFEKKPNIIGVTTDFEIYTPNGLQKKTKFIENRFESKHPGQRLRRHLWFLTQSDADCDLLYSMFCRKILLETNLFKHHLTADFILAAEIVLKGQLFHIPKLLAHRFKNYDNYKNWQKLIVTYIGGPPQKTHYSQITLTKLLINTINQQKMEFSQKIISYYGAFAWTIKNYLILTKKYINDFRRRKLNLTKKTINKIFRK